MAYWPRVHRYQDWCTGHGCYPPRPNAEGSPDVFCNTIPVHRLTDEWEVHCCPPCHGGQLADGSATVFVNNLELSREGDPVNCGSFAHDHSFTVWSGPIQNGPGPFGSNYGSNPTQ